MECHIGKENFEMSIRDGVLACQLVNLAQPDLVTVHFPDKNKVRTVS